MYERFTHRARKAMQLACQEAMRFNHEYLGTEHILLGLVKEGAGVAAQVLKNLGIDLRRARLEVEKIAQTGPDRITMGKLPQTPGAKAVIAHAIEEARALKDSHVGTNHILLGLLHASDYIAAQVLTNFGLKLEDVRREVLNMQATADSEVSTGDDGSLVADWFADESLSRPSRETFAQEVFLAWEKLRIVYNAILLVGLCWFSSALKPGPDVAFLRDMSIVLILANAVFSFGPVVEGYLCWFGLPRLMARCLAGLFASLGGCAVPGVWLWR